MPTYDYECPSCGKQQEIFHSMNDTSSRSCPSCKKGILEKQISKGSGIIFKGSGFYETDYKRKSSPSEAEAQGGGGCSHKSACKCSNQ